MYDDDKDCNDPPFDSAVTSKFVELFFSNSILLNKSFLT